MYRFDMHDPFKNVMTSDQIREEMRNRDGPQNLEKYLASMREDLKKIDHEHGLAVGYAREFMTSIRLGKAFSHTDALPMVDRFIEEVFHNEAAAAAICKLKAFDEYTFTHCINVAIFAVILGKKLGLDRDRLKLAGLAGVFHDVGKALIPSKVLNKPGKLSDAEMELMRGHSMRGYTLLKEQEDIPEEVLLACLEHHERFDGSGYPRQLRGDAISELSRIIAVVDVYDALTSKRVYKDPLPPAKVLSMMYKWRVGQYYPGVLEQFIKCLGVYPVGSLLHLSSGDHAVVLAQHEDDLLHPVIRVVFDEKFQRKDPAKIIDLAVVSREEDLEIKEFVNPVERNIDVYRLLKSA